MPVEFPERFNMADYFLYHNLEEGRENKTCLYFEDRKWTYGETARLSNQAGNALRALGAVITMVNPLLPAADYEYYLEYTRARVAVIHQSVLKVFAEAALNAKHLRG